MRRASIFAVVLFGGCATLQTAVVAPGHAAVVLTADGRYATLGEGATDLPGDAIVDDFDLRQQTQGGTVQAVTKDGVPVGVGNPTVSYRWAPGELIDADRTMGSAGAPALISAIVSAAIAREISAYRWDELDSPHIREAQEKIVARAAAALRPKHLELLSVELKGLFARLPGLALAVTQTSAWEQRSATAKTRVDLARQSADRLRSEAQGLAAANAHVAPTLSAGVLQHEHDDAWQKLLTAKTTEVEVATEHSPAVEVTP